MLPGQVYSIKTFITFLEMASSSGCFGKGYQRHLQESYECFDGIYLAGQHQGASKRARASDRLGYGTSDRHGRFTRSGARISAEGKRNYFLRFSGRMDEGTGKAFSCAEAG